MGVASVVASPAPLILLLHCSSRHEKLMSSKTPRCVPHFFNHKIHNTSRAKIFRARDADAGSEASTSGNISNGHGNGSDEMLGASTISSSISASSLSTKLAIALGIAALVTIISIMVKLRAKGSYFAGISDFFNGSLASTLAPDAPSVGFTLKFFGHKVVLPAYAPGWIYFWLLMAAGCGLFISEEALNIWVGTSIGRLLAWDGSWTSFMESFSRNASYIITTALWVYWGVCISDMIPFYLGRLFRQSGASDDLSSKLGIDKEKAVSITETVQKYGNLVGFVERFSLGVRNPTSFVAGSLGISPERFFAGVCCGGLITLPVQFGIGFLFRERPMMALASVATVVGIWTAFPYAVAALTAFLLYLHQRRAR
ncbi:hypothetical protein Sjap_008805 [Stephania japonica]|uniref:VTT domain-containing protein n=1 Tax=Stephania japonica TaxID=461633 RepID=A0AAP0JR04_9MAGN